MLAVGLNYRSHVGTRPIPKEPEIFYKPITRLQDPGAPILHPSDSKNTHYEGEPVLSRQGCRISPSTRLEQQSSE